MISKRWSTETYFKHVKGYFGFQAVQVRHKRATQRYGLLIQFAYLFIGVLQFDTFSNETQSIRRHH